MAAQTPTSGIQGRPERLDTYSLFVRYRRNAEPAARDALVHRFLGLAREVARRYNRVDESLDDLVQVACLGLVKAVDRFDPERGVAFSTYAVPTMIGELKRHLRDTAWAVHLPRGLNERWLAVERAERELRASLRRSPTVAEIGRAHGADRRGRACSDGGGLARAERFRWIPRGRSEDDSGSALGGEARIETIGADRRASRPRRRCTSVAEAVHELSRRDREVLKLRFIDELTQSQIADRIDVSQMQVLEDHPPVARPAQPQRRTGHGAELVLG